MKRTNPWSFLTKTCGRVMVAGLIFALCGAPEALAQATQQQSPPQSAPAQTQSRPNSTVMPDPAAGPLQPVPTQELPNAPSATPAQPQQSQQPAAPPQQAPPQLPRVEQPLGTGAAEAAHTEGGAASKPAGTAIAPAKQRQVRSLLIKLGAIGAAGAALGLVYGLTRGTSSLPPNAAAGTQVR